MSVLKLRIATHRLLRSFRRGVEDFTTPANPAPAATKQARILFLDYLRAIACLLVVLGHVYFLGFNGHEALTPFVPSVTRNLFGPDAAQRNVFTAPAIFAGVQLGINVGVLGVSIFFLISGFVILKAVERESATLFLIKRAFRIYPVSIAAVLVTGAITAWYCQVTGTISPHTWASMFSSGLVANGFLHNFDTVPVLWSLEVELLFYVLMAALAARRRLGSNSLLVCGLLCLAFTLAANTQTARTLFSQSTVSALVHLSFDALQITFLLIGAMIYRMTSAPAPVRAGVYVAASIAVFVAARYGYLILHVSDTGGVDLANGTWALAIFFAALWSGMRWRWIKPLRWVGDISYPLYLVHVPLAWISLAWLSGMGWGMPGAGAATGILVVFVAWIVHLAIESPARRLGSRVGKMVEARMERTGKFDPSAVAAPDASLHEIREVAAGLPAPAEAAFGK